MATIKGLLAKRIKEDVEVALSRKGYAFLTAIKIII